MLKFNATSTNMSLNSIFDIKVALDSPLFNEAYLIASEAHAKQYRKDGKPYMTHIDAVVIGTYNRCMELKLSHVTTIVTCCIAALHDTYEDHGKIFNLGFIHTRLAAVMQSESPADISQWTSTCIYLIGGINAISKKVKGEEPYHEYVLRVGSHTSATIVKIQDLVHNMSDLPPGNMRDKYDLTKYFLQNCRK